MIRNARPYTRDRRPAPRTLLGWLWHGFLHWRGRNIATFEDVDGRPWCVCATCGIKHWPMQVETVTDELEQRRR